MMATHTESPLVDGDSWPPAKSEDEWLLFYLRGLTFAQIARWCRVSAETVRYSIKQRETVNPSLFGRRLLHHDRPRYEPPANLRGITWDKRYAALFRFVAAQGRFPKQLGSPAERGMQRWLYKQRLKLEAGELELWQEELLDKLGRSSAS